MKEKNIILMIISLLLIVIPFFINAYSIYKLLSLAIGIILLDISLILNKKIRVFLLFLIPLVLIILTYGLDYLKVYSFNMNPIYVFENKINEKVSVYNSLFYRIYKCDKEYLFDNHYQNNFACNPSLIKERDINNLLSEPIDTYKKYSNEFIKVTGKISKIEGSSNIYLQAYTNVEGQVNGYVKFNETSKLKVNVNGLDISKYRIYDYITVVGLLENYDKSNNELLLSDVKIEENKLYDNFDFQVIESSKCDKKIKEYADSFYTYCIENIYLDYKVDKYELSYALKDKKITFDELISNSKIETKKEVTLYKLEKFNILSCNEEKNILMNKNSKIDYSLCKE